MKIGEFHLRVALARQKDQRWGQAAWNTLHGNFDLSDLHGGADDPFYTIDDQYRMWEWLFRFFELDEKNHLVRRKVIDNDQTSA